MMPIRTRHISAACIIMLAAITGACADTNPTGLDAPDQPARSVSIAAATAWTGSGPGIVAVDVDSASGDPRLSYTLFGPPTNTLVTWDFETTADQTATVTLPWSYEGDHPSFSVVVYAIVNDAVVATLIDQDARFFQLSGTYTFTVSAGDTYGFRFGTMTGSSSISLLNGEFTVDLPDAPVDPVTQDDCKDGGWMAFGFKNQGQCIAFVQTGHDSR